MWRAASEERREELANVGEEWLLLGPDDMDVLNSSSSLPADCTSMHSGECTVHGQHLSSSHTSSVL